MENNIIAVELSEAEAKVLLDFLSYHQLGMDMTIVVSNIKFALYKATGEIY